MEYLRQISTMLDCTPKQLFVDNIELFEMFKPMKDLTLEQSATKMFKKLSKDRIKKMFSSIRLNYVCDNMNLSLEKDRRIKRFERDMICKKSGKKATIVLELPWDRITKQKVKNTCIGKRRIQIIQSEYDHIYFEGDLSTMDPCSICYEPFTSWDDICRPNVCAHQYHMECIKPWFKGKRYPSCPYCRMRGTGLNYLMKESEE